MKLLKIAKHGDKIYMVVDNLPEMLYHQVGADYVGTALDYDGNIVSTRLLRKEQHGGRPLTLKMQDGSTKTIQDYWYDVGNYKPYGESSYVAISDLASLQRCGVYMGYEMLTTTLNTLLDEYYTRDKVYTYDEVEAWVQLQHKWYDVYIHGKKIPFMMNKIGDVVTRETKEKVHAMRRIMRRSNNIITLFRIEYLQDGHKIKLEDTFDNVFNASVRRGKHE